MRAVKGQKKRLYNVRMNKYLSHCRAKRAKRAGKNDIVIYFAYNKKYKEMKKRCPFCPFCPRTPDLKEKEHHVKVIKINSHIKVV